MRIYLLTLLFIFLSISIYGQASYLPKSDYRVKTVQKVYRNLLATSKNASVKNPPQITIIQRKKNVAAYSSYSNQIKIETLAYDVCTQFGADSLNALAVVIAHELMHFYKKHHGASGFSCSYYNDNKNIDQFVLQEEAADFWGLFTAYLGGYQVVNIAPKILQKLYQTYQFSNQLIGYPPLEKRMTSATKVIEQLESFIQIFEAANYLTLIQDYEKATYCYQHILVDYQSAELYNNLGLTQLLHALKYIEEQVYLLPFELDVRSRLYPRKKPPFGFEPQQMSRQLLKAAVENFQKAIQYDTQYASAFLNLACAKFLQKDKDGATLLLNQVENFATTSALKKLDILKAILWIDDGQLTRAQNVFRKYQDDPIAKYNLEISEGWRPDRKKKFNNFPITHLTANWNKRITYQKTIRLQTEKFDKKNKKRFQFQYHLTSGKKDFAIAHQRKMEQTRIRVINNRQQKAKEGLGVGDSFNTIQNRIVDVNYQLIATTKGTYVLYPKRALFFQLGQNNRVVLWGMYEKIR